MNVGALWSESPKSGKTSALPKAGSTAAAKKLRKDVLKFLRLIPAVLPLLPLQPGPKHSKYVSCHAVALLWFIKTAAKPRHPGSAAFRSQCYLQT